MFGQGGTEWAIFVVNKVGTKSANKGTLNCQMLSEPKTAGNLGAGHFLM
jgi:hypothetical protein